MRRETLGEHHPDAVGSGRVLGYMSLEAGRFDDAEPLLRRALEQSRTTDGADLMQTSNAGQDLARLPLERTTWTEAVETLDEAIEIAARHLPDDHHVIARRRAMRGWAAVNAGGLDSGAEDLQAAVLVLEKMPNDRARCYLGMAYAGLAMAAEQRGDEGEADRFRASRRRVDEAASVQA